MIDTPRRVVLLGHPIAHSISPQFQNAALRAAGIALRYEAIDVHPDDLTGALEMLAVEHAAGNVTIPHKEAVAALCVRVTPLAARVGAVNVFWHEDGRLIGDNSDVGGAEMVIRALLSGECLDATVALVGAGGSAAAVLCAAERCGASEVRVYNRTMSRAASLVSRFPGVARRVDSLDEALDGATLVINATPVGLSGDAYPVAISALPKGCAVFDLTYRDGETPWVTAARAAGHRAADGEGMLIEQGAIAFERWFGVEPDRDAMWKSIH